MTALVDCEGAEMPLDDNKRPLFDVQFDLAHDFNHPRIPPIAAEILVRIPMFCVGNDEEAEFFKYSSAGLTTASMDDMLKEFMEKCDSKEDAEFLRDKLSYFATMLDAFIEREDW